MSMSFRGKVVGSEHYFHVSTLDQLDDRVLLSRITAALNQVQSCGSKPNVIKFNERTNSLSLLAYPDFDTDPFPALASSWVFSGSETSVPSQRNYQSSLNPPILHRKELLVPSEYPDRQNWLAITSEAEALGLFDDTATIGFRLNWENLILSKGYSYDKKGFRPIGNNLSDSSDLLENADNPLIDVSVQRHLTALSRPTLSAPVQLLIRHGLLTKDTTFFDYGCGKGDDIATLIPDGICASGWDPHFAPSNALVPAHVINLGFVVNVIEDPAERVEAVSRAFSLCTGVLAVSVMLYPSAVSGTAYRDGVLTSRKTFQKYFTQSEIKDYLEQILHRTIYMAGPGIAFVFKDIELEQHFSSSRFKSRAVAQRLIGFDSLRQRKQRLSSPKTSVSRRISAKTRNFEQSKGFLDQIWRLTLELGRWPTLDEVSAVGEFPESCPSFRSAIRMIEENFDLRLLEISAKTRIDDLRVFFAAQKFQKLPNYKSLSSPLQIDIKAFFGDYRTAQASAMQLLEDTADTTKILEACKLAAEQGFGWLNGEHSLQIHIDLIERLPAVLRAYVCCGLILWDSLSEIDLVKIHIHSRKLTLLEFDDFDRQPLPLLRRRIKINLGKLDYDVFDYGTSEFPKPVLFFKSRFLHEDLPGYAIQKAFDDELDSSSLISEGSRAPEEAEFIQRLQFARLKVDGMRLCRETTIPPLDQPCGANFTYRSLIECGETQRRLNLENTPTRWQTYNAIHDLAVNILDPIIDYFGGIRLTYGFCSHQLGKYITSRVAHHLDQHASFERNTNNKQICSRGGAACDFIVDDEDMGDVADWIIKFLPYDRLYFYGSDKPLHVSYSEKGERKAYRMVQTEGGRLMPRRY